MSKRRNKATAAIGLGAIIVAAGAFGFDRSSNDDTGAAIDVVVGADPVVAATGADSDDPFVPIDRSSIDDTISTLQSRVESTPRDHRAWATLALAYVQQARITVDPSLYPLADDAIDKSFAIDAETNDLGYVSRSALASARHDFPAARDFAIQGLEINPYSALLHGALSDAQIQLGEYEAGFDSVQQMLDLSPDVGALARASYVLELRGDTDRATELMQRALDDAPTAADRAFALYGLGELAHGAGDPNRALELHLQALDALPGFAPALFGRAEAEGQLGQVETALDHFAELVEDIPEPGYLVAYGALLESVGRDDEAAIQYAAVEDARAIFASYGELPDADSVMFAIQMGDVERAITEAETAIRTRPFIEMHDAYAWALYSAGRYDEALDQIELALELNTPSAQFRYHAAMIRLALGDEARAREDLREALEINPLFDPIDGPLAAQQLQLLEGS